MSLITLSRSLHRPLINDVCKPLFNNFQIFFITVSWAVIWIIESIYNGRVMVYLDLLEDVVSFSIGLSTFYLFKIFADIFMPRFNNNVDTKQEISDNKKN